ncbi:MAG: DUF5107 domain-containing protein [Prevotellaceae bacterium]|nr:DUF5107 domain-containing protein [Prevotellaceae bacterium]
MIKAKAWREDVVIPTYEVGKPEKNPIFLEKRVYQGSSGVVYPYPVIESISNEKTDHTYHAIFLENEYIKVMILPELGGRVQMAYDKIKQRHFIYYNQVIKPALVGLAGPWISGGIEFNWPQHHRPSTFMPIDSKIEENEDGSVTVWVNEMERMFHQKGMAGFTLRPGCAYLEIKGVVYNRTDMPQTFLWWANPAVAVNDAYQSVFPPDINAVFDHGKRAVSSFPIATGTYYNMDYSAGVDISNYKNIFVPTSYMAVNSKYDFEGGYENDTKAGMLHVANHHVSPGKKQWTWGNGDFGRAWDRNLTDEDGPYIELMAGVFTENQPDFTWLMPHEEKTFVQYFMPYRELGIVKQASKDFMINVEPCDGGVEVKVFATSRQNVKVVMKAQGSVVYEKETELSPENLLDEKIMADVLFKDLHLYIIKEGKTVLTWTPEPDEIKPIPDPAEAALRPAEIKTVEQLFLTGLHLEQYRHATYCALDYYEEGLRREPLDTRCNNAIGLWYIRRGRFDKAESYLRTAVKVLQKHNPNPYWGEPLYNLGLCLRYQALLAQKEGKDEAEALMNEAYDWFYKSTWNAEWQSVGFFACAQISCMQKRYADALEETEKSLVRNWHNHKTRALRATMMKRLGIAGDTFDNFCRDSLSIDPFNYVVLYEMGEIAAMKKLMHNDANNYNELALDYWNAGLYEDADKIWKMKAEECGDNEVCFPNRLEDIILLSDNYKLGCLYYDKRQYDLAQYYWELSAKEKPDFPQVHRCLALVYYNKLHDAAAAIAEMERAFELDKTDSRIFMELDQLHKKEQYPHKERLEKFEDNKALLAERDDLLLEYITLLNLTGRFAEAKELVDNHKFHPWEGGEGKVPAQYQLCRIGLALQNDDPQLLKECLVYPHNLGEGKLINAQDNDFYYLLGEYEKGTEGPTTPAAALYYNDAKPDKIFYAGLCYMKLGQKDKAKSLFNKLISFGKQHLFDDVKMDYFAVSLPDLQVWDGDLNVMNRIHCNFMLALGYKGLTLADGNAEDECRSQRYLSEAEKLDINHLGIAEFKLVMGI